MSLPGSFNDKFVLEGACAHYAEPSYYTKNYARRVNDVRYYVELGRLYGCPVLEYGCGNGRIAIPLAVAGTTVVGVDLSPEMLDDFRAKLEGLDPAISKRVRLVHGDMRQVKLRQRFGLVLCTFNTLLHLYTRDDVEQFFARVRGHMEPDARFVFDVSVPCAEELSRDPNKAYAAPKMRYPPTGELVKYAEYFDYDPIGQVLFMRMRFEPVEAPKRAWTTLLTHRQFYPQELEALLHYNGFEVESVMADFGADPLGSDTDTAVWTVRVAKPKAQRNLPAKSRSAV